MIVDSKFLPERLLGAWRLFHICLFTERGREREEKKTVHIPTLNSDCTFSP